MEEDEVVEGGVFDFSVVEVLVGVVDWFVIDVEVVFCVVFDFDC